MVPLTDAYSILVLTTVIGQSKVAARLRETAPMLNVRNPSRVWFLSFAGGNLAFNSRVTRSNNKKYSPAPAAVLMHDAVTPAHSPLIPSCFTMHDAVTNMLLLVAPACTFGACILVLMTSKGCSERLDTRPAPDPAKNDVVPLFGTHFLVRSEDEADEEEASFRFALPILGSAATAISPDGTDKLFTPLLDTFYIQARSCEHAGGSGLNLTDDKVIYKVRSPSRPVPATCYTPPAEPTLWNVKRENASVLECEPPTADPSAIALDIRIKSP